MRENQPRLNPAALAAAALSLLALFLIHPASVSAQWTQDGSGNINNTNPGNVKVGGAGAPTSVLHTKGNLSSQLTGTVAVTQNSAAVTGTGTAFTTEMAVGDSIKIGTETFTVSVISSATSLTLDSNYTGASASGLTAFRDPNLFAVDNGDGVNKLVVSRSGQVGIGVINPGAPLDVSGAAAPNSFILRVANTVPGGEIFQAVNNLGNEVGSIRTDIAANGFLTLNDGPGTRKVVFSTNAESYLLGGNLGIGTMTPEYKLDVAGWVRSSAGGFVFPDGTAQTTALRFGSTAGTAVQGNTTLTVAAGAGMSGGGAATLGSGGTLILTNSDRGSAQNIFKSVANAAGAAQFSAGSNTDTLSFEGTGGTTVSFDGVSKKVIINSAASNQWTNGSGSSISYNAGNVGIGTGASAPGAKLDVRGSIAVDGVVPATHSSAYSSLWLKNNVSLIPEAASGYSVVTLGTNYQRGSAGWTSVDTNIPTWTLSMGAGTGVGGAYDMFELKRAPATSGGQFSAASILAINSSGNVGVGAAAPAYKLDVAGQIRSRTGGFVFPDGTTQATAASPVTFGSAAGTAVQGNTTLTVAAGAGMSGGGAATLGSGGTLTLTNSDRGSAQNIFKSVANAAGAAQFSAGSNTDTLRFEGTGGTTVSFDSVNKKVVINSSSASSSGWTDAGTSVKVTSDTAKVGIGTASPVAKLDISGGYLHVSGACGGALPNTQGAYLSWNQNCGTGETDLINHQGAGSGGFAFMNTANGGTLNTLMSISGNGDVTVSGNISAKYQDVAEWVPSSQKLSAGTVVVLDAGKTNHVLASTASYDTKVAGVVSAEPGLILGVGGEGKLKVATTGRVKVRVDATRGAIQVGDLLVTSDVEGVAMKSVEVDLGGVKLHRPGTIIGKALEPLASGTGEILVLLSLQ